MSSQTGHQRYNVSLTPELVQAVDDAIRPTWTNRSMIIDELLKIWLDAGSPRYVNHHEWHLAKAQPQQKL
jgi:metal-responsive CopG/Arc/MetJ family transcriptional regulator